VDIMNKVRYEANKLEKFLKKEIVSTMQEMKDVLGARVNRTVMRKLKELSYRTSYSHGNSYYTLDKLTQFDEMGIWSYRSVWFSKYGTLLSTLRHFVATSEMGYSANELKDCLHVSVKESLLKLTNTGEIARKKVSGCYIYSSVDASTQKQQFLVRQVSKDVEGQIPDEVKAAIILFISVLDEKQRRLFAGLESLKLGEGGDSRIAELVGFHHNTVARGRRELLNHDIEPERIRKAGAGRQQVKKNTGSNIRNRKVNEV